MKKHALCRVKARMIRAAADVADKLIECGAEPVAWIQAAEGETPAVDSPKRFKMRAYTGGPMVVGWYGAPVVIDLLGLTAKAPLPILMNHDIGKIVGHADEITTGDSSIDLAGAVSGASAEAAQVTASAKQGFPWKASVGAQPEKMEFVGEGVTTRVNGKTFTGPLYVARKSSLREVSFVAVAADGKTTVKVAAAAAYIRKEPTMKYEEWVQALGFNLSDLTDQQKASLQAKYDAEIKAAASAAKIEGATTPAPITAPAFDAAAVNAVYDAHRLTIKAQADGYVEKIVAAELDSIRAKAVTAAAALVERAVNEKRPAAWLEVECVKAAADMRVELIRAERPKAPAIHGSSHDAQPQVIEAALCMGAGLRGVEAAYQPQVLEAAHAYRRHNGASIQTLILAAATANGYSGAHRIHRGNYDEVMRSAFDRRPIQAAGFSTHALTTLLTTVGNKFLLEGFTSVEQVWKEIAAIRPVNDFKQITSYRMLDDGVFEEVGPNGEIKHGTLSQESFTNQAKTYAKMLALTRQDIINDDLGAFDTLRERFGANAGRKLNSVFWGEFLDDAAFFNDTATTTAGGHDNLITAVLGESGIAAAVVKLAKTDANGHPLGLAGLQHLLLTGATLNPTARKWYVAQEMRDTTASTKFPTANIYQNQYRPVMSAYITSSTAWYLLPIGGGSMAPMEVCFLDGVQNPTIESTDADFNTLGVQFRGYFDFGCAKKEWRGSVKSAGTG